jgi:hypothetical protein
MRKIKAIGLAFVAVLAMSAVAAGSANAADFMSEGNVDTVVSADQVGTHVFTVDGSNVTCTTAHFESALLASPASSVRVHPEYKGCTAFGFVNATVNTEACDYVLSAGTLASDEAPGELEVDCEGGSIVITAATCEAKVGSQTFSSGLNFVNNTEAGTVTLEAEVTGIVTNKTKDGFLCPLSGTGEGSGAYTGDTLVTGEDAEGEGVSVTLE